MAETNNNLITKITNIIIEQTFKQKIPTVVFLSDIEKEVLVKNIVRTIKDGNKDESGFTPDDWDKVAEIMEELAKIPLLLKETNDIDYIRNETETFIEEMNNREGVVIINSEDIKINQFTIKENISIIIEGTDNT